MDTPWYKSWFNSPYYPLLYSHRNDEEAERFIKALLASLALRPDSEVLDAPCGNGRHGRMIAKLGRKVTGIDLSENAIANAVRQASPREEYLVQDIRRLFRTNYYDLALNLFSSFGYSTLRDDKKILSNMNAALRSKGFFVMDYLNVPPAMSSLVPTETRTIQGINFDITRSVKDDKIIKTIEVADDGCKYHFRECIAAYTPEILRHMLEAAGFDIRNTYGDYSLARFIPESSPRVIFVVQKNR